MQVCQAHLEFKIETPTDEELKRRYAGFDQKPAPKNRRPKIRNRKSKHTKRMERLNRAKESSDAEA